MWKWNRFEDSQLRAFAQSNASVVAVTLLVQGERDGAVSARRIEGACGMAQMMFEVQDAQGHAGEYLTITFKARNDRKRVISGVKRISRPGLRVYARKTEIPRVLGGLGIAILSTSQGVMSGRQALHAGVGGEVLAYVW